MRLMRLMKAAMKVHDLKCDGSGLILDSNKKKESIPNPSCLMMHALEERFQIINYICTHNTGMWYGCVHRKSAVSLILMKE